MKEKMEKTINFIRTLQGECEQELNGVEIALERSKKKNNMSETLMLKSEEYKIQCQIRAYEIIIEQIKGFE